MSRLIVMVLLALTAASMTAVGHSAEVVGQRPYEMANRQQDDHAPLVDFEGDLNWRVEAKDAAATFSGSREQQLWGQGVGKLSYHATGGVPEVRIVPAQPVAIRPPFDTVSCWIYGNNWGWAPDPATPQVNISALFSDSDGKEFQVHLATVNWKEWFLVWRRLPADLSQRVANGGAFRGFVVTGGSNQADRALYFDNLAVFTESFAPLAFAPRPQRGIPMFPGQAAGTNTGPGRLPFPTRLQTILPDNLATQVKTSLSRQGDTFSFSYQGSDGRLTYRLTPTSGTWSDISAQWPGRGGVLRPCVDGGVYLRLQGKAVVPDKAEHLGTTRRQDTVVSRWRLTAGGVTQEVTYTYRLWHKSLVVDVAAPGGNVAEVRYGRAVGLEHPRLVTLPYYLYDRGARPAIVVAGGASLFLSGHTDWYLSNASALWAANSVEAQGTTYNGGTRYTPQTDGRGNDCYERLFITLSPRFEEVLPNIPNPRSPWMGVAGTRLWRAHGAGNRASDGRYWSEVHRYGMTQVVVTDHETMWRDGGESFTFRTVAAPGKGGDQGAYDYARVMQDKLGFVYGPYNNYTDFAPVNEFWSPDLISRTPEAQMQGAWMRCYAPKPARAVEYCARLAPEMQRKFRFSTAYCDVHTAVSPWERVDYDARVPGAGTFAGVFYPFGEIMLLQKAAWGGPVYSEGGYHAFYCGLTDGNYGQDQSANLPNQPWLVDFDLRKMHPLCCNFGMGNPGMFYSQPAAPGADAEAQLDRFLAATVAFGHTGFLAEGKIENALRSYYLLQQLHSRYALATVASIRYAAADGQLLETSAAVASGAYTRSQLVTRYADGTVTAVNGHPTERMAVEAFGRKLDLPPNGYAGWTQDGKVQVESADRDGHRADYAATPAYLYVDGRGEFTRFAGAAGNGIGICRVLPQAQYEIIPVNGSECGFVSPARAAVALDKEGKTLGPAQLRSARGLTYVEPVPGAFSYLLSGRRAASPVALSCARDRVVAGEQVVVRGQAAHLLEIPATARAGERIWRQFEGGWIDFTVVPLAGATVALHGTSLRLTLTSNLPDLQDVLIKAGSGTRPIGTQSIMLAPGKAQTAVMDLGPATVEGAARLAIELRAGPAMQHIERGLHTSRGFVPVVALPEKWQTGMRLRGGVEQFSLQETRAEVTPRAIGCGGVTQHGLFMHPPWQGGVGTVFALYEPVTLPAAPAATFRASVGKADGSDPGDGIVFKLAVVEPGGAETVVAQVTVTEHQWVPLQAGLARWAGQSVRFKLMADVGPHDNSSGDWSAWAGMRLESQEPVLLRALDTP